MSKEVIEAAVKILGKTYQIKCPATEINSLKRAASYLDTQMRQLGSVNESLDKVAITAALNVVHQLLTIEQHKETQMQNIHQRLHNLHAKIERALVLEAQMELQPTE